jgi:hypothetical protein
MPQSYYDDATALLTTYLGCAPERRIEFVRQLIGSQDTEIDLTKVHKAIDVIFLSLEKARGQLASQLATAYCLSPPTHQLALFRGTAQEQHLHAAAHALFAGTDGRLRVSVTTGEVQEDGSADFSRQNGQEGMQTSGEMLSPPRKEERNDEPF